MRTVIRKTCEACGGSGKERVRRPRRLGQLTGFRDRRCRSCHGDPVRVTFTEVSSITIGPGFVLGPNDGLSREQMGDALMLAEALR